MAFVYVIAHRVTKDDATSARALSFCKLLRESNKDVVIFSLDEVAPYMWNVHEGFRFISLRKTGNSFLDRLTNHVFLSKSIKRGINMVIKEYDIEGFFFYDLFSPAVVLLKKYARQYDVPVFHDSVEWYSPEQFSWGKLALPYLLKNLLNTRLIDKQVKVFAISKYLQNHFSSKGIRTMRLPVVMDMKNIPFYKNISANKLVLLYAGSPGRKDYLKEMIEGIALLDQHELNKIEFNIVGVNDKQLVADCNVAETTLSNCGTSVTLHGRLPKEIVITHLQRSDFTVLLRSPELRYAKAGFPTKVVESLSAATPVICNITSDLGDYLSDGKNSLIVEHCSSQAFAKAIRRALSLTMEEKYNLCNHARHTAEQHFDLLKYSEPFKRFLCEE